LYSLC